MIGLRRQHAGKRDHHEALRDDYVVIRPGPNFDWFMGSLAAGQPAPAAPEADPASDDKHSDTTHRQFSA